VFGIVACVTTKLNGPVLLYTVSTTYDSCVLVETRLHVLSISESRDEMALVEEACRGSGGGRK